MRLIVDDPALEFWIFASGCGNERVGDQGMLRTLLAAPFQRHIQGWFSRENHV